MVRLDPLAFGETRQHVSCVDCGSTEVERDEHSLYRCRACGVVRPRAVIIDPAVAWWIAPDGEYWHESAGVLLRNPAGEYLLFRRTRFPDGMTIPAGHVGPGEAPDAAARRELWEETSIRADVLQLLGEDSIVEDSCRRGADAHHWHTFLVHATGDEEVTINSEGTEPVWLSPSELHDSTELTPATSFLVMRYVRELEAHGPGLTGLGGPAG